MRGRQSLFPVLRMALFFGTVVFVIGLFSKKTHAADIIEPEADVILKTMANHMTEMTSFSMSASIDFEIVTTGGQKLQISSSSDIVVERPSRFYISRKGMMADAEYIYDGDVLTLHGKNLKVYAQKNVPGTIDDAILAYEFETGLAAPVADLLFSDPYGHLSSGIESGGYVGIAYVDGVECHHLAFREDNVDWQLWVKVGDEPFPIKYVITSKWHIAAPQYEIRLKNWNSSPDIEKGQFDFVVPEGATKQESIPVNEMGEFVPPDAVD